MSVPRASDGAYPPTERLGALYWPSLQGDKQESNKSTHRCRLECSFSPLNRVVEFFKQVLWISPFESPSVPLVKNRWEAGNTVLFFKNMCQATLVVDRTVNGAP